MTSISSSSILVDLNISVWGANIVSKTETKKITEDNNANHDAAKVHKNLMSGTTLRKQISDHAAGTRQWHINKTLPWADKGTRLLPTKLALDYKSEMNKRESEFHALCQTLYTHYPQFVQYEAAKNLGSMHNPSDYPDLAELKSRFDFRLVFSPVPQAGDFRVDVSEEFEQELKESYEAAFTERLNTASRDAWKRLHAELVKISEKLTERPEGTTVRYYDSLVANPRELCALLKDLNIANDPELEKARRQLELTMGGVHIEDIKDDPAVREDTKKKVDRILSQFEW